MIIDCIFKAQRKPSDIEKAVQLLASADILSGDSSIVKIYEENLCKHFNTRHAIAVSSGTAALHASLVSVINPGDEVLVPAICVPMTVSAILQAGGIPVFYDCQKNAFFPDATALHKKITESTRALITVSMWGYAALDEETLHICKKNGITVIEDAAQAAGTSSSLGYEGTIGDIGCFSTHEFKLISTGEGGFVLTNSDDYADKIRSYTHIGFNSHYRSFGYSDGLNYKLSAFQAAFGILQLEILSDKIAVRQQTLQTWRNLLNSTLEITFLNEHYDINHNGYSLCCLLKDITHANGKDIAKSLHKLGINTDSYRYKNTIVSNYPLYEKFYKSPHYTRDNKIDFPHASQLADRLLVLPCHEQITSDSIQQASVKLLEIIRNS